MKNSLTNSTLWKPVGRMLFASFALTAPSLSAQTFAGRDYLAESPVGVQAFIYPDARKTALKIRLENRTSDVVRVRIVNADRKTVYDDYVTKPTYYGRFDVSALPYGMYTVELNALTVRYTQDFRIEQASASRIVIITQPIHTDSLLSSY